MLVLAQRIFSVMFPSSSSSLIKWSDFSHKAMVLQLEKAFYGYVSTQQSAPTGIVLILLVLMIATRISKSKEDFRDIIFD